MKKIVLLPVSLVFALALVACGGGGYDASYDCEQTSACCEELGTEVAAGSVDSCINTSQLYYDNFSDSVKSALDEAFESCSSQTSCDFIECVTGSASCSW